MPHDYVEGLYEEARYNSVSAPLSIQALPRACNEALILAALSGKARHGYQIVLDLEARSSGAFQFKHGTLYPILHRLEQSELIEGDWSDEGLSLIHI